MLSADGNRLDGEDLFSPDERRRSPPDRDQFAVRFHLHPSVKANRLTDGHGAMLMLPNKEVWTFNAYEDRIELEESVYLAGTDGPRRTADRDLRPRPQSPARAVDVLDDRGLADAAAPRPRRRAELPL